MSNFKGLREEFLLRNTGQKVSILRNLGIISRGLRVSSFSDDEKWDYLLIEIEHKRMFDDFRSQLDLHSIKIKPMTFEELTLGTEYWYKTAYDFYLRRSVEKRSFTEDIYGKVFIIDLLNLKEVSFYRTEAELKKAIELHGK